MPKIAFLFPGQGAQFVGMGRELDQELPAVRAMFDRAGEMLGIDLRRLCIEGPAEALESTDVSQPAIFVASLAALESLKQTNPEIVAACEGAAGLSLGEYTALVFAGAMDFEAGLKVVRRRGQAMQAAAVATPSGMTSVLGLDEAGRRRALPTSRPFGRLWKANLLGPGNIVVSGETAGPGTRRADRHRAGRHEGRPTGRRRRVSLRPDEASRRTARPGPRSDAAHIPANSRLLERRRHATLRPRRYPPHPRGPGPPGGSLGGLDASDDRRRLRHLLRDRPRPSAHRPAQTHRPEDALHERPGEVERMEAAGIERPKAGGPTGAASRSIPLSGDNGDLRSGAGISSRFCSRSTNSIRITSPWSPGRPLRRTLW